MDPKNDIILNHIFFMNEAYKEAKKALKKKEVPIGAVIVKDGKIISRGHNVKEKNHDATCHAEIIAIKKACRYLQSWRLEYCEIYSTLEPCMMCAGAIIQARIKRLFIGAYDPKAGAAGSIINLFETDKINHHVDIVYSILEDKCSKIIKDFFQELRKQAK